MNDERYYRLIAQDDEGMTTHDIRVTRGQYWAVWLLGELARLFGYAMWCEIGLIGFTAFLGRRWIIPACLAFACFCISKLAHEYGALLIIRYANAIPIIGTEE